MTVYTVVVAEKGFTIDSLIANGGDQLYFDGTKLNLDHKLKVKGSPGLLRNGQNVSRFTVSPGVMCGPFTLARQSHVYHFFIEDEGGGGGIDIGVGHPALQRRKGRRVNGDQGPSRFDGRGRAPRRAVAAE